MLGSTKFAKTENSTKFFKIIENPPVTGEFLCASKVGVMILFSYTNLDNCVLSSAFWPSVEMRRCVQMWAQSRTSYFSELIFLAVTNFTLTHQKQRSYQFCLLTLFSQYLSFFLDFLEHLSPYFPEHIYYWF